MDVTLLYDHRFLRDEDGIVFSASNYNYELLSNRYLGVFDRLFVVARVEPCPAGRRRGTEHTEGPGVTVVDTGAWTGLRHLAASLPSVLRAVRPHVDAGRAVIAVSPGRLSVMAHEAFLARPGRPRRPYGVEMIGDPTEQFAPGAHDHRLSRALSTVWPRLNRRVVRQAAAVSYVSRATLEPVCPPGRGAHITEYSSIELPASAIVDAPRLARVGGSLRIAFIGSMNGLHKGPDVLIRAVALIADRFPDVEVWLAGSGHSESAMRQLAVDLGVAQRVHFVGQLRAGDEVRQHLDHTDVLVLPSVTEGLPRVVIEAMSRGLPVLASDVGGIVGLLPAEDRFPPRDPMALAAVLASVLASPERRASMAARNLLRSHDFEATLLQSRRHEMYSYLADAVRAEAAGADRDTER